MGRVESAEQVGPEYALVFSYEPPGAGPSSIRALWVDQGGGVWLEATDGGRVVVPSEIRKLVAKRMREEGWHG